MSKRRRKYRLTLTPPAGEPLISEFYALEGALESMKASMLAHTINYDYRLAVIERNQPVEFTREEDELIEQAMMEMERIFNDGLLMPTEHDS